MQGLNLAFVCVLDVTHSVFDSCPVFIGNDPERLTGLVLELVKLVELLLDLLENSYKLLTVCFPVADDLLDTFQQLDVVFLLNYGIISFFPQHVSSEHLVSPLAHRQGSPHELFHCAELLLEHCLQLVLHLRARQSREIILEVSDVVTENLLATKLIVGPF